MASPLAAQKPVDDRISIIAKGLDDHHEFSQTELPGLKPLLRDYLDSKLDVYTSDSDRIDFVRRFLKVFKDSKTDFTYENLLARHDATEQKHLEAFVDGTTAHAAADGFRMGPSLGFREEIERLREAHRVRILSDGDDVHVEGLSDEGEHHQHMHGFHEFIEKFAAFFKHDSKQQVVTVYQDAVFQNWGRTVENTPRFTCVPTTTVGVQRIVRFAKEHDMSVRCSGYRHSWAPVFGRNGQILISLLQLNTATKLPNTASLPLPESPPTELESIELLDEPALEGGRRLVRVGCATTNERLRRWCVKNNKVTIPMNVIMVEITLGGSNGPICHGAGRSNKTLSDIVRRIEYVDANGELRTITEEDTDFLRAASGAFGLMGVITHLTLALDPMTYAEMRPAKLPVVQAVPPPPGFPEDKIPPALRPKTPLTNAEKAKAQADFEDRASNYYYCEWFWFPYSDLAWVNCWNNTTDATGVKDWPSDIAIFLAFVETFTMNVLQYTEVLQKLIEKTGLSEAATTLFSRFAMLNLPEVKDDKPAIKTYVSDALHFQRAIQNVRVRDMEVEMPLLPKKDDPKKPDYALVQQAWWDAIVTAYEHSKDCPMRMPLELRIMGDSNVIMAPQRGNELGTASIEVLTLESAVDIWKPFAQEVLDKWMSYTDAEGKKLKTRPHWAKEWVPYSVDGKPWVEKLKNEDYRVEIAEFKDTLAAIGKKHGWTLADIQARFSNELFDKIIYGETVMKN